MDDEVLQLLERDRDHLDHLDFDKLVELEERDAGRVDHHAKQLITRPDGPLKAVSEQTQCDRVDKTAAQRWDVAASSVERPSSFAEVASLLEEARKQQRALRFVGSARSLSRAPQPPAAEQGAMVATCEYGNELPLETETIREGIDCAGLYRAEGGRVLADILIDLDKRGKALADMGSGDFQSLAGALLTSTHGSGMRFPAVPGLVRSMDVATFDSHGRVAKYRVEPSEGITDPAKFSRVHKDDGLGLIQSDAQFNAWTVSMGCLGAVYSMVIDIVPSYWLHETRTPQWWSEVKASMEHDLNSVDYYELLASPWPERNEATGQLDHRCLVTRRNIVREADQQHRAGGRPLTMALASTEVGRVAAAVALAFTMRDPLTRVPKMLHTGVTATKVDDYVDKWFEVLLLRLDLNAESAEIGVPMRRTAPDHVDPANAIAAAERMFALDADNRARMRELIGDHKHPAVGHVDALCRAWREAPVHTSPISLRFVREEQAQLSMQYGAPTCMIEMPMPGVDAYDRRLRKTHPLETKNLKIYAAYAEGRRRLFESVEAALMEPFGIRPHWGQRNSMTWATTEQVYPEAAKWREVYERANVHGVFDNPLTDQLGISKRSGS